MHRIIIVSILLSASILLTQTAPLPKIFSKSLDAYPTDMIMPNAILIYGENLPTNIKRIMMFGNTVFNDSTVMNIKNTHLRLVIYAIDSLNVDQQKVEWAFDSLKMKTVYTDNPPTYITPHYRKNINPELFNFYLKTYSDSIHRWFNGRNNKLIRQIIIPDYDKYCENYYIPWMINIYNSEYISEYISDPIKFSDKNILSTKGRQVICSIDGMEQVKEGKYAIKSGLLQPGDSVYVSVGVNCSPLYHSVIKFIDLRNPDNNRHSVIASNDTLRIEAWLNPKDKRLVNLAKKYGRTLSKRLAAMKERAERDNEDTYEYRYWTDLMIIPAKK